ncbi:hypothetical protein OV079_53080 [Nannocystis pusilla]|uniref:Uncharacterized protein n=1 Tax=Nannocystis pusilla TaxID=889268 RepID=A0A9X3J2S3_9BACT|nr:hypothetical protein [Nannocystis pusilla]MCY1014112.1 hypothetical protein [Nannocystis pusilla]
MSRRRPRRAQGPDDLLERDVLVLVGREHGVADPREQGGERGIVGEVEADRQGVDEEAGHRLELDPAARRGGQSDHQIVLIGESPQDGREYREDGLRQGGAPGPRKAAERGQGGRRGGECDARAAMGRGVAARAVGGQCEQGGRPGEAGPPAGERGRVALARLRAALPGGVIGVGRRGRSGARRRIVVEPAELVQEQRFGPGVGDDVVQYQPAPARRGRGARGRRGAGTGGEVEGAAGLGGEGRVEGVCALGGREVSEVEAGERESFVGVDDSSRRAGVVDVAGAQDLVAADQRAQGG